MSLTVQPYPKAPTLIAEIGCNHGGDVGTAEQMIRVAAEFCGVEVVKFQKRHPQELLSAQQFAAPHPNAAHAFGDTYGAHREYLEFSIGQHDHLRDVARSYGVQYAASAWDLTSARQLVDLSPSFIKVPSAVNTNLRLIQYLCREFNGPIHVSLGMTRNCEEQSIIGTFRAHGRLRDLVLYACTSGYPVPFGQLALREITRLHDRYTPEGARVGFSGHHLGIAADVAAMTLGAEFVERHFTLDRTAKGTDHVASLEPDALRRLHQDLDDVAHALTFRTGQIMPIEMDTRAKLKWTRTG